MKQETIIDKLDLMLYEGDVSLLEYVQQSSEYNEAFRQFCQDNGLPKDNHAAEQFFDRLLKEQEDAHTEWLD